MQEIQISYVSVFRIYPSKKEDIQSSDIDGGQIELTDIIKDIFNPSFNGKLPKKFKMQPFHFNFLGTERKNEMREKIINCLTKNDNEKDNIVREMAYQLSKIIDDRTGELLFTCACGESNQSKRIVFLVFPHDDPIQLKTKKGKIELSEIENAFSKSSSLRKAIYLESPLSIGRNDLTKGLLIDSSAGRVGTIADYWLTEFVMGVIELLPLRGTNQLIKGIKAAQSKAKTVEEKNSVKAVFFSLLSESRKDTTINEIGAMLVGEAKTEYNRSLTNLLENNARFAIDFSELKKKIKTSIFILKNGIEIHFPVEIDLDPDDFIEITDSKRYIKIFEEINEEIYK